MLVSVVSPDVILLTAVVDVGSISIQLSEKTSSPVETERFILVLLFVGSRVHSTDDSEDERDMRVARRVHD